MSDADTNIIGIKFESFNYYVSKYPFEEKL